MNDNTLCSAVHEKAASLSRPVTVMEVCGTHTMAAFRTGLRSRLPENVLLRSGPGCPVCVTPDSYIDHAVALAGRQDTIVTTFGDMVRVPGTDGSLAYARARGGHVTVVYSPQQALAIARAHPDTQVVFLGVGFETTTPLVAWTIQQAACLEMDNFSVLCAHKTIAPAMHALCKSEDVRIDGFMCPGHVSVITGARIYDPICRAYRVPCVVSGFEYTDMMETLDMLLTQIQQERAEVGIQYRRSVGHHGNAKAAAAVDDVFEPCDTSWRGIGTIPGSGMRIREAYARFDTALRMPYQASTPPRSHSGCRCGDVLRARITPQECGLFAKACTPDSPIGPCMVSSEGTCAAWFTYTRMHRENAAGQDKTSTSP
jgi:hydrogenase expression/formation protein HypD